MLLLLARHGNTFEASETVVWVGARTDLPLTVKGREQAAALAAALAPVNPRIERVVAGPLKRTCEHAQIAVQQAGFETAISADERLREIDYGLWEGKSSEEIRALGGEPELRAWNDRGEWPRSPQWTPSPEKITADTAALAAELADVLPGDRAALLVTSNGILKFFLRLVPGAFEEMAACGALKVATGHCCALRHGERGWRVAFWNREPSQIALS
jgi:broad specificity phosphatase PhoE